MKTLMKFSALAVALVGMTGVAGAQASRNASLTATANVKTDVSVTGTGFSFGSVYRNNGAVTVAPNAGGKFDIVGAGASTVTVSVTANPTELASTSTPADKLPVVFSFLSTTGSGTCADAFSATASNNVVLDGTAAAGGAGKVCVGGTVTPVAGAAGTKIHDDYAGVVSVTVGFP